MPIMPHSSALAPYKSSFLHTCIKSEILKFGSFTLKSGRISPYFFNTALFHKAYLYRALCTAYAQAILAFRDENGNPIEFDVIFGPAYKGIPLATGTVDKLADLEPERYGEVSYSFDRKEKKDHGEGGTIVGADLKGQRILIIDDVVTAGTAKKEAFELIKAQGGVAVGIVVALDRQEKRPSNKDAGEDDEDGVPRESAIGQLKRELGIPIFSVLTLNDLIDGLQAAGLSKAAEECEGYRAKYRCSD